MTARKDMTEMTPMARAWVEAAMANVKARDLVTGEPVMCTAARMYCGEIVRMLIGAGADVHARNRDGMTPLHIAVERNAGPNLISRLLEVDAPDVNTRDADGRTPIFYARSYIVTGMLALAGADVRARDDSGKTPLHFAVATERVFVATVLFSFYTEADMHVCDKGGRTPLDCAETAAGRKELLAIAGRAFYVF